ncbi:MAG TPA: SRPBCC domain-containing protein [Acidimicrobiales bacterium]|nr:SRPBCC domain-containing protein [Acidimicrobiales bacterium]
MQHRLHTDIDIDAPPEVVWEILTDLEHYGDWNPFIESASGTVAVGARLSARIQPPGGRAMTFKPTVIAAEAPTAFGWQGRLGLPGIFDGHHRFELEATPGGKTHLVHTEQFSGVLVRFMRTSLDTKTLDGFALMNDALKHRAEARVGRGS